MAGEELAKIASGKNCGKKRMASVSVQPSNDVALGRLADKLKVDVELDMTIYRDAQIADVIENHFPQNFKITDFTETRFAETLPEIFKELNIKGVEDISMGFKREVVSDSYSSYSGRKEIYPMLGLKVPSLDEAKTRALKDKVFDLYSEKGKVINSPQPMFNIRDSPKEADIDVIAQDKNVEVIYIGKNFSKGDKYNLWINFGDTTKNYAPPNYARADMTNILKIVDQIENLSRKKA
jgi:hypothetical protein